MNFHLRIVIVTLRRTTLILLTVLFIVLIYTSHITAGSSISWLSETEKAMNSKNQYANYDRVTHSDLFQLEKESIFLHNRLVLSSTDSIYLMFNLADSTVAIELGGIVVEQVKFNTVQISPVLKSLKATTLLEWLTNPIVSISEISTIEKEPVTLLMAPKDTIQKIDYSKNNAFTENYAGFLLHFDNGLIIQVRQKETSSATQRKQARQFKTDIFNHYQRPAILRAMTFRKPDYYPEIVLETNRSEVISIYRAIPSHVNVSLTF